MIRRRLLLLLSAVVVCMGAMNAAPASAADENRYAVLPPASTLDGAHARQQLLVESMAVDRMTGDRTADAQFGTSDPAVARVDDAGLIIPVGNGDATITATIDGLAVTATVSVRGIQDAAPYNFRNDVQPVLAKLGCNSGACHGALAGKGGFKLSLRGYDALADFHSITRDARGRRVELADPGRSLLLLKPTMAVPHKGGLKFDEQSPAYEILSQWIAEGATAPGDQDAMIESLEAFPAEAMLRPGDEQRIVVRAKYDNGAVRDVTPWAKFASTNEGVATVDDDGRLKVIGHGAGALTVWYASKIVNVSVISPYDAKAPRETFSDAPRNNVIDELVLKQLQLLNLPPAGAVDDATFLRRVSLDTIGKLPTADETRAFLADASPDKRAKLVDSLLDREEFVDYWAYQWSDLLLVNGNRLRPDAVKAFYRWIRERVSENTPWDEFARQIVLARGGSVENGATNFYALHQDPETMTENISQAFLGLSIGCAKCHNHPLEKWTNDQYYGMSNLLARVRAKGWGGDARNGDGLRTVFVASRGDLIQPSTGVPQPPAPLDGEPLESDSGDARREYLADWLTAADNPYFARAIANRVWANFFNVGLVEPIDDLRLSNPASNEELLAALADYLVEHDYDLKALMRLILQSAAYARSSTPASEGAGDARNFSHYFPQRLMAEVALDAISQVADEPSLFTEIEFSGADFVKTDFYPEGTRAIELYDSAVVSRFLRTFGRHQRTVTCQCERSNEPSLVQALHLSNGETILKKLAAEDGKLASLVSSGTPNYRIVEELYLSALSRYPSDAELAQLLPVLNEAPADQRRIVLEDMFWAVLTSREFMFNH
ncbi:DUF1549 and DUF1553 domain-containing protein [Lacipirellula limnantheis]|uniref:Bacterial Ig-like domain (Group 2) n=1 Tax=Lacipirellula limnantheis TaxID=2528024 RepID=A0A517TYL5_9BACT|nr:DUF1549 and DUF1553 domain-containing protein [Lacipirellula limnantheis]QDT73480.1 Bacterial Ig-like domain (group 2) [Lacipirellula limnantheis]